MTALFAHVDTGSDDPGRLANLRLLQAARRLLVGMDYTNVGDLDNAIEEIETRTCFGCGGPIDPEDAHGRCGVCEDRAEAAAS